MNAVNFFVGRWKLSRSLYQKGLYLGNARGTASFNPVKNVEKTTIQGPIELVYKEEGIVCFDFPDQGNDKKTFPFRKSYIYQILQDEKVEIYFVEEIGKDHPLKRGDYFTSFSFQSLAETQEHLCILDHYVGNFTKISENEFSLSWKIHGPNKDDFIETKFQKISSNTETDFKL